MSLVRNHIKVNNVLISCYDKTGLKCFAAELVKLNSEARIYCSSGTFSELKKAVPAGNLVEISEYTGTKEMPAGLVKTLHPKVHSGILANLNDKEQKSYIESINAVVFDLVVVNLYPFSAAAQERESVEKARTNIDIGGVSLIEAAAKNFLRVAVIVSPVDYERMLEALRKNDGSCSLQLRLELAKYATSYISSYLDSIHRYFEKLDAEAVRKEYDVQQK